MFFDLCSFLPGRPFLAGRQANYLMAPSQWAAKLQRAAQCKFPHQGRNTVSNSTTGCCSQLSSSKSSTIKHYAILLHRQWHSTELIQLDISPNIVYWIVWYYPGHFPKAVHGCSQSSSQERFYTRKKTLFWANSYQPIVINVLIRNQQVLLVPSKLIHN